VLIRHSDKAKEDDEKRLVELYKKLQKRGGLRRGAGGYDGFDMSDSEDEVEMRQRKKRAAFQKQTNALLQDQKVKALAEDDKKKAFFNTLADFADEGDYDYLVMPSQAVEEEEEDSQSQEQSGQQEGDNIAIPDSQDDSQSMLAPLNPLKRKSPDTVSRKENRPPPNERRTKASDAHFFRRPMNKEETESMINELIEDPRGVIVPDSQLSDGEGEADLARMTSRKPIVDRLSLSRQSSLSASSSQEHLAFHAPSNNSVPGFRVPSLIRQATSNLSISSERSTSNANTGKESGVRRGGTGRSNIHAQAREAERRALLEKKEGKRKEALRKQVVGMKKGRSALQDLGGGFE
jgi:mediator of replication checkpoint protein 1